MEEKDITSKENFIIENYLNKLSSFIPSHLNFCIKETLNRFEINNILRISHFLSQVAHESQNFKKTEENLNYSAKRLVEVFPKYFPTLEKAKEYERKPEKIASLIYANRMGNGDESTQDGWKYRGRGYIQLTGKFNYKAFSDFMKEDFINNPDLVAMPRYGMLSAGWFWYTRNLNSVADLGKDVEVIKKITKKINGGYNGLEDRIQKFNKVYNLLSI